MAAASGSEASLDFFESRSHAPSDDSLSVDRPPSAVDASGIVSVGDANGGDGVGVTDVVAAVDAVGADVDPGFDDDFGGFEGPSMTPVVVDIGTAVVVDDDDDEFGDFGTSEVVAAVPVPETHEAVVPQIVSDPYQEARVERVLGESVGMLAPRKQDIAMRFAAMIKVAFPLDPLPDAAKATRGEAAEIIPLADDVEPGTPPLGSQPAAGADLVSKMRMPNSRFENQDWYILWKRLMKDLEYGENLATRFRWKKSQIRVDFLKALDIHVAPEDHPRAADAAIDASTGSIVPASSTVPSAVTSPSSVTDQPSTSAQSPSAQASAAAALNVKLPVRVDSVDSRMEELMEAKRLCSISEDDMKSKTNEELEAIIKAMAHSQVKMQEQGNFWLDAKEQLAMDAEQHQRMIASLVQYAKQQVVGSKGGPGAKGKKKPAPTRRY